ncbi:MAG: hypothetical protein D084_Lepto4C00455G0001 [Leptospirillum sp. Group IV 'UBA BS']|nr:MAG: hypothetical protein D084_Lepto4C00455G0001 [Leptospirillum sp. Group IV 'UBA BS']
MKGELLGPSHPVESPVFQNTEKGDLGREIHGADLVQEKGSVAGRRKPAVLSGKGTGKRPLFVAEKLRVDEISGDGSRIDGDKRLLPPGGELMDGAGDQLLAGPRLPGDQDGDRVGGSFSDPVGQSLDGRTFSGQKGKGKFAFRQETSACSFRSRCQVSQQGQEFFFVDRFFEIIGRTLPDGLDGGLNGRMGRHDHHRHLGVKGPERFDQFGSGRVGKLQVEEDRLAVSRKRVRLHDVQGFPARSRLLRRLSFSGLDGLEITPCVGICFYYHNATLGLHFTDFSQLENSLRVFFTCESFWKKTVRSLPIRADSWASSRSLWEASLTSYRSLFSTESPH